MKRMKGTGYKGVQWNWPLGYAVGMGLWFILTAWAGELGAMGQNPEKGEKVKGKVVGGQCDYRGYKGTATITSIRLQEGVEPATSSGGQRMEVRFTFSPKEPIEESWAKMEGKEHLLTMTNSTALKKTFLEKYGIQEGKSFECLLKVITKGTCTPILFDFPEINLSDYEV